MMELNLTRWSVSDFIRQYNSARTRTNYISHLKYYFGTIYQPKLLELYGEDLIAQLDETSLAYLSEDRDFRIDLIDYNEQVKDYSPQTRAAKLSVVYRYFEDNGIDLPRSLKRNLIGRERDPISEEFIPSQADIKKVLDHLLLHGKTAVLILSSSGMRANELLSLRLSDLELDHDPPKISLPASITKTKQKRITFITHEARDVLMEWLNFRLEYAEHAASKGGAEFDPNDDRVFPFTYQNLLDIWTRAAEKAGYGKRDENTNRLAFRIHNLRKFFRTHGQWNNPDVAEALMGHASGLKAVYARFDQAVDILREGYLKAEKNLSVLSSTSKVIELEEKVQKKEEDIDELVKNLSVMRVRLENKIGEQEVVVEELRQTNQMLLETILSQGSRMDELEKEVQSLSEKNYAEYWDEYIARIPDIQALSR